jgi:hypothetical protein
LARALGVRSIDREKIEEWGYVEPDGDGWRIAVKADCSRNREKFTIAHELGHLILKPYLRLSESSEYKRFRRSTKIGAEISESLEEELANQIAAYLLLPTHYAKTIVGDRDDLQSAKALASAGQVSLSVAIQRCLQMSSRPLVVFVARSVGDSPARVLWFKATESVDRALVRNDLENELVLENLLFYGNPGNRALARWEGCETDRREFNRISTYHCIAQMSP